MSPDELMLFVPLADIRLRLQALGAGLAGVHHLALDVSDARAVFRVEGPAARRVIAAGAPVDLAPEAFWPGDFRRTRLGEVAAAIWMRDPAAIELMCFRSVADFVADWLAQAARDAGAPGPF
jgi:sarcosine oxidase subunit gamma